jgi:hypothetical protein
MAPKHHPTPLSGGDRKALNKELGKSRAMTNLLAAQSAEMRAKAETMLQQQAALRILERAHVGRRRADRPVRPSTAAFPGWRSGARAARLTSTYSSGDEAPADTFVHDLASRLPCRKCAKAGRRPAATLLQLAVSRVPSPLGELSP